MKELGVNETANKVGGAKKAVAASSSRKRPAAGAAATAAAAEPGRRSSRARKDVSYKEPTLKELEAEAAAADGGAKAAAAGLYKLNPVVTHSLKAPGFIEPLNPSSGETGSSLCFRMQLAPLHSGGGQGLQQRGVALRLQPPGTQAQVHGGAVQVESS
jgi:hypothetical protein